MNHERERRVRIRYLRVGAAVLLLVLMVAGVVFAAYGCGNSGDEDNVTADAEVTIPPTEALTELTESEVQEPVVPFVVYPHRSESSAELDKKYSGKNGVLINAETGEIVAGRNEDKQCYPASLTKVMTLIVAVENIKDLSDTVEITYDMLAPMIAVDASLAGFAEGEKPTLEQVLYGMVLESGAEAALAAACYVAGSETSFVDMMNEKAEQMGLTKTHFTNVVGLHDKNHYSTAAEMAAILSYAMQNETCRKILSAVEYKVPPTKKNPEGLTFASTLFGRMYGDEMPGVKVLGGKTGYTDEADNCIETFAEVNGTTYILVLCGCNTRWDAIYDTLSVYSVCCAGGKDYEPPEK